MRWKDVSIVKKILSGYTVIVFIAIIALGHDFYQVGAVKNTAEEAFAAIHDQESLLRAETAHLAWAGRVATHLAQDAPGKLDVVMDGTLCAFGKWFYGDGRKEMERRMRDTVPLLQALEGPHLRLHASVTGIQEALTKKDMAEAVKLFETISLKELAAVQKTLGDMTKIVAQRVKNDESSLMTDIRNTERLILISIALLLVGGLLLSARVSTSICKPLHALVDYAQTVAKGNLRLPDLQQKDEVGQLADAMGHMVEALEHSIADAQAKADNAARKEEEAHASQANAENALRIADARQEDLRAATVQLHTVMQALNETAEQLTVQIVQAEQGAKGQAQHLVETAAAMNEMSGATIEVTSNAALAAEYSNDSRVKTEEGAHIMRQSLDGILEVQRNSVLLKEDMKNLTQHAANINQIMSVISDIADQTNLLALNAAIEAARAGEAGRGFAVVADEVRKLAEKTMASTTDVSKAIISIQQSADKNMAQVDKTVTIIEETTELSHRAGDVLNGIQSMVVSTADQVRVIASASEEQSVVSEKISRSISEVKSLADETVGAMNASSSAVEILTRQSHSLQALIEKLEVAQHAT